MTTSRTSDLPERITNNTNTNSKLKRYVECCTRIFQVMDLLNKDIISKEGLIQHLTITAEDMESLASDPKFLLEDEIISSVESAVVPKEIQEWLAATFTNTAKVTKKSERPAFRAVANAILATIIVEKIFKKSSESAAVKIPSTVAKMFDNNINNWDFDVFNLSELAGEYTLKYTVMYLFLNHNILRKYKISFDLLEAFLNALERGYVRNKNPFFNALHATDVAQTIHYFINQFQLANWFTDLQVFVMLFVAVVHDYDDPGFTNQYLMNTRHKLAMLYNDIQVRENHHIAAVFRLLQHPTTNCLRGLSKDEFLEFRRLMIDCTLSMDWSQHFHNIRQVKSDLAVNVEIDKMKAMCYMLHMADISHPTKDSNIYIKWVKRWEDQMFKQGDLEYSQNIPYSPICSRNSHNRFDVQTNFLAYIIDPSFQLLAHLLDEITSQNTLGKVENQEKQDQVVLHRSKSNYGYLFPWENQIVLNKSMWQRKITASQKEKKSSEGPTTTN